MALAIVLSTFGTVNALTLAGARACYAIATDGLFFSPAGRLNRAGVPGWALGIQGLWSAALVLPRTYNPLTHEYGNLYSNLLEYVISDALLFYILTILAVFRLRRTRPSMERPYMTWGYPWLPALYVAGASAIVLVLFVYRPGTTWPGLAIVALGAPVYYLMGTLSRKRPARAPTAPITRVIPALPPVQHRDLRIKFRLEKLSWDDSLTLLLGQHVQHSIHHRPTPSSVAALEHLPCPTSC